MAIVEKVLVPDMTYLDGSEIVDVIPLTEYECWRENSSREARRGLAWLLEEAIDGTVEDLQLNLFGDLDE